MVVGKMLIQNSPGSTGLSGEGTFVLWSIFTARTGLWSSMRQTAVWLRKSCFLPAVDEQWWFHADGRSNYV